MVCKGIQLNLNQVINMNQGTQVILCIREHQHLRENLFCTASLQCISKGKKIIENSKKKEKNCFVFHT